MLFLSFCCQCPFPRWAYLDSSEQEILNWKYGYAENRPSALPTEDEQTQIWAVVAGYSIIGNENQNAGSENGITRQWAHSDMLDYIHKNTIPYAGVM